MRRHAKASSARSEARKPSGKGTSPSGRLRLTILLATVAAFMLVPVAQAAANGNMIVEVAGSGSGEVSSVGGFFGFYEGSPPIECSGPPTSGTCETELVEEEELSPGVEAIALNAVPAPGSEFTAWVITEGTPLAGGCKSNETKKCIAGNPDESGNNVEIIAVFEAAGPSGPTNKRTLTITKSGTPNGAGTVKSKPKGINCAAACSKADASLYKNSTVVLTEKPATGSTFTEWRKVATRAPKATAWSR